MDHRQEINWTLNTKVPQKTASRNTKEWEQQERRKPNQTRVVIGLHGDKKDEINPVTGLDNDKDNDKAMQQGSHLFVAMPSSAKFKGRGQNRLIGHERKVSVANSLLKLMKEYDRDVCAMHFTIT